MHGFVANRAGDLFFMLVLVGTVSSIATVDLTYSLDLQSAVQPYISLLLLGGAAGKSAQLGLHSWLPLAIEAPTPISALIHAATLVTAGVYLLVRLLPLIPGGGGEILLVSAATLLLAGLTGLAQTDLKRTIAFSTCSQVAYIVLGMGNGSPGTSLFLLFTHALYKALLFISAGVVIHAAGNVQDTRLMGANARVLPLSKEFFGGASLALCAFPHTAGDFSKDLLVEELGYSFLSLHQGFWLGGLGGTLLTGAYSGRLWRLIFAAEPRGVNPLPQHEPPFHLSGLLILLAAVSTLSGWLTLELFGTSPTPSEETYLLNAEQAMSFSSALPLLCGGSGLLLGFQAVPSQMTT